MQNQHKINLLLTTRALLLDKNHQLKMSAYTAGPGGHNIARSYADKTTEVRPDGRVGLSSCFTTTCFAGYGPIAGIEPTTDEFWEDYVKRVFGAVGLYWVFLFDGTHPNCARHCAIRALIFTTRPEEYERLAACGHRAISTALNYDELLMHLGDGTKAGMLDPSTRNLLRLVDEALNQLQKDV